MQSLPHKGMEVEARGASPDKAEGSLVGGALQLQGEVLEAGRHAAGGGVVVAAHLHVQHDRVAAQRGVHQRLAHQPVRQVARPGHLHTQAVSLKSLLSLNHQAYLLTCALCKIPRLSP